MNNEPVAWMVNDKLYKDIFEAEHYSKFTNKPIIPLYNHLAKTLTDRIAELEKQLAILEGEYPEPTINAKIKEFNGLEAAYNRIAKLEKENSELKYEKSSGVYDAEPVAWIRSGDDQLSLVKGKDDGYMIWKPLYTYPAKTLTDEEIGEVMSQCDWQYDPESFARAILRKAQEK